MASNINLDTSQRVDITCRKGDTFSLRLTVTDADDVANFENGHIFRMEVRDSDTGDPVANTADPAVNFTITVTADDDDVTAKYVDLTLSADTMKTMPSGLYVYDVEQKTDDSTPVVSTLIYGTLKINEDITITA
ncbi:MAG TPA: hypothetical protein DCL39_05620 [Alteromonas macleodii]|nr:hypothetical protein [Alteromonas macleodii]|tara:strand:+ start:3771 stop:4172 length:402 start_codon:yes stop_codon:yes gene_type:complete